jgi:hypothetical protein
MKMIKEDQDIDLVNETPMGHSIGKGSFILHTRVLRGVQV